MEHNFSKSEKIDHSERKNQTEKHSVKEGVNFVFEQNPGLASIGTPEQYSHYLDTVYPESKVREILYHGTTSDEKFDVFKPITKDEFGGEIKNAPVHFSDSEYYAKGFAKNETLYKKKGNPSVITALINIKEYNDFNKPLKKSEANFRFATEFNKKFEHTFYTALPEQIHILGSKRDIEQFKEFVEKQNIDPNSFASVDNPEVS